VDIDSVGDGCGEKYSSLHFRTRRPGADEDCFGVLVGIFIVLFLPSKHWSLTPLQWSCRVDCLGSPVWTECIQCQIVKLHEWDLMSRPS
jgi:hypothetical protein